MDEKDQVPQEEFDLEDILKEFGGDAPAEDAGSPAEELLPSLEEAPVIPGEAPAEEVPEEPVSAEEQPEAPEMEAEPEEVEAVEEAEAEENTEAEEDTEAEAETEGTEDTAEKKPAAVTGDTIRLDDLSQMPEAAQGQNVDAVDTDRVESTESGDTLGETKPIEPVEEIVPPAPIPFRTPRSRLRELKKKLVAGPEKRYYELTAIGVGRLQIAMLLNLAVITLNAAGLILYDRGLVPENRLQLLIFGQCLAMLVSALLGSHCMIDAVADLFKKKFSLNLMLVVSFAACCADAVLGLLERRIPCCAAFSLAMAMGLWNRYQQRTTEMGQMDTMRKATRLDSVVKTGEFFEGRPGLLRGEGQVEDFMEHYEGVSGPERVRNWYALISLLICCGIALLAGLLHDSVSLGLQILAASLLVAIPASFLVTLSRPMSILERRLHMVGTVLCGWQGVEGLSGQLVVPLDDNDVFPVGSVKLNGVKFYGDRKSDQVIAYATALIRSCGGSLEPVFDQLCRSRECPEYETVNFQHYNGGIGGEVCDESVLLGSAELLRGMGVEVPEGTMVSQAVYCAIDGQFCAVFALSYAKMKSATAGLVTLCGYRKLTPALTCSDFMITENFLRSKFGINTRRIAFPDREVRQELRSRKPEEEAVALALTTQDGLAPMAYAITGARAYRTAARLGVVIHMIGGILGMLIMLVLAYLGSTEPLTPLNILLYQLVWAVPGLLVTEWTRTV